MQQGPCAFASLSNIPQVVAYGPGEYSDLMVYNPDATNVAYLEFWEDTDDNPARPGTDAPWDIIAIQPKNGLPYPRSKMPFAKRLSVAAVSAPGGSAAAISPIVFSCKVRTF